MKNKRLFSVALICVMVLAFTGCSVNGKKVYFTTGCDRNTLFMIDELKCSTMEAKMYLMNNKNIYANIEGNDLYVGDFNKDTITSSLKSQMLEHLTTVYSLALYADLNGINLDDNELNKISNCASEYYDGLTEDEIDYCGCTEDDVKSMYTTYGKALKAYSVVMDGVDEEISEDEARVIKAYVIFNDDKNKISDIEYLINIGNSFESIAASYTKLDSYLMTFGRGEYPKEVEDVVFNLDNDEVSQRIETADGYYYFKCVSKYVADLSEENKESVVSAKKQQLIDDIVNQYDGNYFSEFNQDAYDELTIDNAEKLTTDSFFFTIQKELKF